MAGDDQKLVKNWIWYIGMQAEAEEDSTAIQQQMLTKGKFIIATNELNVEKLSDENALKAYKEQQHVERGFRFLKDPHVLCPFHFSGKRTANHGDGDDHGTCAS